jgi:hypothetical protein
MLGSLVVHRVGRLVDRGDVVAVGNGSLGDVIVELNEELTQPYRFSSSVGDGAVLGLRAGIRGGRLSLG